jgi:hypothetical protein
MPVTLPTRDWYQTGSSSGHDCGCCHENEKQEVADGPHATRAHPPAEGVDQQGRQARDDLHDRKRGSEKNGKEETSGFLYCHCFRREEEMNPWTRRKARPVSGETDIYKKCELMNVSKGPVKRRVEACWQETLSKPGARGGEYVVVSKPLQQSQCFKYAAWNNTERKENNRPLCNKQGRRNRRRTEAEGRRVCQTKNGL